jgi:hypothetical protein
VGHVLFLPLFLSLFLPVFLFDALALAEPVVAPHHLRVGPSLENASGRLP